MVLWWILFLDSFFLFFFLVLFWDSFFDYVQRFCFVFFCLIPFLILLLDSCFGSFVDFFFDSVFDSFFWIIFGFFVLIRIHGSDSMGSIPWVRFHGSDSMGLALFWYFFGTFLVIPLVWDVFWYFFGTFLGRFARTPLGAGSAWVPRGPLRVLLEPVNLPGHPYSP